MEDFRVTFPLAKQPILELSDLCPEAADLPSLLDLPYRALTHSGRSAIRLALELLGIGGGEGVLLPTYHCPTMVSPVEHIGAKPVFYPITDRGEPDLQHLGTMNLGGIKAILVPHLFGLPRSVESVAAFFRKRRISVIEDCAHCFYGKADGTAVGTTGDFAIGSLPKFFPVIEGGLLASTTRSIPKGLLASRHVTHELRGAWDMIDVSARSGRLGALGSVARCVSSLKKLRLPHELALDQASEGAIAPKEMRNKSLRDSLLRTTKLRHVESFVISRYAHFRNTEARRRNYRAIADYLKADPRAGCPFPNCEDTSAPYVFPLYVENADLPYARMRAAGIPVFRWDRIWPGTPIYPGDAGNRWSKCILQIACHQSLRASDVSRLCQLARLCLDTNQGP